RVPSQTLDGLIEPSRIQAPVGHQDHLPIRRHHSFEGGQQSFPIRTPFSFLHGRDDFPSYRDTTPAIHDTDREDRESLSQRHGIHRKAKFLFALPSSQDRPQQISETRLHLDFSPFVSSLGLCFIRKFSQALSQPPRRDLLDFG